MELNECYNCGEVMHGDSAWCDMCGYAEVVHICDRCVHMGNCDKCGESLCFNCIENGTFACCGMVLCGGEDGDEDTCSGKHETKKLPCDHEGCNYNKGACRQCAKDVREKKEMENVQSDRVLVKELMVKAKSDKFKSLLQAFLHDPSTNEKRKHAEEKVKELEVQLRRANKACDACRCGRANYPYDLYR